MLCRGEFPPSLVMVMTLGESAVDSKAFSHSIVSLNHQMRLLFERGTFAALEMVRHLTVAVSVRARSTRIKFPHLVYTIEIPKKANTRIVTIVMIFINNKLDIVW